MKPTHPKSESDRLRALLDKIDPDEVRLLAAILGRDPLTGLYTNALIVYCLLLAVILMWPFSFTFFGDKNHVEWRRESPGLDFAGEGQVISSSSRSFYDRLVKGEGFSIETWIRPATIDQGGPARIVSYSLDPSYRNFTLGQEGSDLIMRLRTQRSSLNGTKPVHVVEKVFAPDEPLHLIITYDFEKQRVFLNGSLRVSSGIPGGDFRNWNPGYPLVVGNEATGGRPWRGKISYLAIYSRALDAGEVRRHYAKVHDYVSGKADMGAADKGLVARYLFNEKRGAKAFDSGTLADSLTLTIPGAIQSEDKAFLDIGANRLTEWEAKTVYEILLNVLLFVPLGFLLLAIVSGYGDGHWKAVAIVAAAGATLALCVEILQYFIESRSSSAVDVIANGLGSLVGALINLVYNARMRTMRKTLWDACRKPPPSASG